MGNSVDSVRELASQVRFSLDESDTRNGMVPERRNFAKSMASHSDLKISDEVTPGLKDSIGRLCTRIGMPAEAIHAYVYASHEIQASCISSGDDECVIRFSSGLVDILSATEFEFVLGHELAHFLLRHERPELEGVSATAEDFIFARYREISADRFGLIACGSLDVAIRALMKSVSGLTGAHLRFDVGRFLAQIRDIEGINWSNETHPTILVRCRALLWYSLACRIDATSDLPDSTALKEVERKIERDFVRYLDGPVREQIEEERWNLAMWVALYRMCDNKMFSAEDQRLFSERFGKSTLASAKSFLGDLDAESVGAELEVRVRGARERLLRIAPSVTEETIAEADGWAQTHKRRASE